MEHPLPSVFFDHGTEGVDHIGRHSVRHGGSRIAEAELAHARPGTIVEGKNVGGKGAAVGGSPQADPIGIHLGPCGHEGDGIDDIRCLVLPEQAAPLSVRLPEPPVVEGEGRETGQGKCLCVLGQDEFLDPGEPVTQDDPCPLLLTANPFRKIENAGKPGPFGIEMHSFRGHLFHLPGCLIACPEGLIRVLPQRTP